MSLPNRAGVERVSAVTPSPCLGLGDCRMRRYAAYPAYELFRVWLMPIDRESKGALQ